MSAVAARYARALIDVVFDARAGAGASDSARAQLGSFRAVWQSSAELRKVLSNPAVPSPKKRAIIERLAEPLALSSTVQNFLFVLIDHKRMGMLPEVLDSFEAMIDEREGVVRAGVTSAVLLPPDERTLIESSLHALTGKKVRAEFEVDPALIGGVLTRIGSTIYDGSVREQLRQMRERLSH